MLIKILISTGILFLFLRFLNLSIKFLSKKNKNFIRLKLILPIIEIIIWLFVILLILNYFNNSVFLKEVIQFSIFVAILLFFSWYFLRDLIAGFILKMQIDFHFGKNLIIENITGKVVEIKLFSIKFQSENSEIQTIFYNKLLNKKISETFIENTFYNEKLNVSCKKNLNIEKTKNQIFNLIKLSYYHIPSKNPEIELLTETNSTYEFEINVFVLEKLHAKLVEEQIQKRFENV